MDHVANDTPGTSTAEASLSLKDRKLTGSTSVGPLLLGEGVVFLGPFRVL